MKTCNLSYGRQNEMLVLPASTSILEVREQPQRITPSLFASRLKTALIANPLDLSRPILVVADKTRLCGYPQYLPTLIDSLKEHGMVVDNLKVVVAYGTHARQSDAECRLAYGDLYDTLTFLHHDCNESDIFVNLGKTVRNTPILLRKDLAHASAIISMGAVSHHYFAGYGGGRKLIFPGCGERQAIYANHALYLDKEKGQIATGCQPGRLAGNPLAEDLFEIEEKSPVSLAIHGILNAHGELCDLLVGKGQDLFLRACTIHGQACEIEAPQVSLAIASCGGFPKDINFIQSHKAIHNAAMFVKDGGLLLLYAECRDGIGSTTFLPWFSLGGFDEAFRKLSEGYEGNGGTALAMMTKTKRIRIGLISNLDDSTCMQIGVEPWRHQQVADHLKNLPENETIACIPNASMLVRKP